MSPGTNAVETISAEEVSSEEITETESSSGVKDDVVQSMLDNDPLSEENVSKGKTIFTKIVDAVIPFIKSFFLALFDFFVAIGRAIISGIKEIRG